MANRLNVLVGATLEQNVEKKLNAELAKLNLNALELEAKFDNNFKDIVDNIKKAITAVDFSKMNNGLSIAAQTIGGIGAGFNNVTGFVDKANKAVVDFNGNLKSASHTMENMDGQQITATIKYDKDGNEVGELSWDDKSAEKKRKEDLKYTEALAKAEEKRIDAYKKAENAWKELRYESIKGDNAADSYESGVVGAEAQKQLDRYRTEWQKLKPAIDSNMTSLEEIEEDTERLLNVQRRANVIKKEAIQFNKELAASNKAQVSANAKNEESQTKQYLKAVGLYENAAKKLENIRSLYGDSKDINGRKFINKNEFNSYEKILDGLVKRIVETRHDAEGTMGVLAEMSVLIHDLDDREVGLGKSIKTDKELTRTTKTYSEFKEKVQSARKELNSLKTAFPEMNFSELESKVKSLEGYIGNYGNRLKATGKDAEYFIDLQKQINSSLKGAEKVDGSVKKRYEQETKYAKKITEQQDKAMRDAREKQLATEEKYYKQKLRWAEEDRKAQVAEAEKTAKAKKDAEDKLEDKRMSEFKKTQSAYKNLHKTISGMDESSGFDIDKIENFKSALSEIEAVLKKDKVATYELINAQNKLSSVQRDANDYVADVNRQRIAQEKLTSSIEKQTASVREQLSLLDVQVQTKATRLGSRYGDLFNEEEFKQVYSLVDAIENELGKTEPDFKKINSYFKQMNANAGKFEANLSATAREAKRIKDEVEILDNSLGRFIQFYGFGEIFRVAKTGITEMVNAVSTLDSSMVELKKVTNETDYVYNNFLKKAAKSAKRLGVSMSDYIDSVTEFSRMGYDFLEAQQIAETANIMQMVSENLSAEDASSYLISIMRGFNIAAEDSMSIIDALNNVDRRSCVEIYRQTPSFYRKTSRNGRPIPRIRLEYVMCA